MIIIRLRSLPKIELFKKYRRVKKSWIDFMNQGSSCLRNSSFCTFGFSGSSHDMEDKKHSLKRHAKKSFACSYDDLKVKHNKQSLGFEILKNQKESLWTVQCKSETTAESSRHEEEREVESYPKVRQRKKRSRTKSSHNEEVKDNTFNSSHSPNSEDNPFLQMLSDELEALKSPKTKYFHPSKHEKNIKSKHVTGTAGHDAVKPINKCINGQIGDSENEGSAELEERCESELEEGELLEDPTETSRSSHSSKRKSHKEMSSKLRQWDIVKSCRRRRSGGMEFTVMTYNILSQDYLEQNQDLYRNCDSCDLDWANRGPALLKEIISHNADIVCLQEVQQDHWERDLMEPLVKHGYQFAYKQKSGLKPDGCAILFKKDKFKKLELVPVDFRKGGLLDRDNVGLILLLQPTPKSTRVTAPKICVATTHLLFNPKRGDVKLAQMMLFLAEIDKYAYLDRDVDSHPDSASSQASSSSLGMPQQTSAPKKVSAESHHASKPKPTYCPVILCGDLNTEPFCAMYKFITTGYIKYEKYTSKQFCGQKEGHGSGGSSLIGKELLLESLDITQSCQYTPVVNQRFTYPPERRMLRNSGRAFHDLYFKSVYGHSGKDKYGNKLKEITTQHERVAATLDYIFYSTGMKNIDDSQATNLPLELLARYKLLTTGDMQEIGYLPNKMFPSDHFCLIARFLLK